MPNPGSEHDYKSTLYTFQAEGYMYIQIIYLKIQVRTEKKTQQVSVRKINLFMLFHEIIAGYSENRLNLINALCGGKHSVLKRVVSIVTSGL